MTIARGKISKTSLGLFRVTVAFNVTEINSKGEYKFPRHADCAYVSGDVTREELPRVIGYAMDYLKQPIVFQG